MGDGSAVSFVVPPSVAAARVGIAAPAAMAALAPKKVRRLILAIEARWFQRKQPPSLGDDRLQRKPGMCGELRLRGSSVTLRPRSDEWPEGLPVGKAQRRRSSSQAPGFTQWRCRVLCPICRGWCVLPVRQRADPSPAGERCRGTVVFAGFTSAAGHEIDVTGTSRALRQSARRPLTSAAKGRYG